MMQVLYNKEDANNKVYPAVPFDNKVKRMMELRKSKRMEARKEFYQASNKRMPAKSNHSSTI